MKYIYVSKRTRDGIKLSDIENTTISDDYTQIKKDKNRWGIFVRDEGKIIGNSSVRYTEEKGVRFLSIDWVLIEEGYRGHKLCSKIVKKTIIKHEQKSGKPNLIKVVIAGGMPMLKCLIKVLSELNYDVKQYKTKREDINNLKTITFQKAIKIEKRNYIDDIWQTLFFIKK